MKFSGISVVWRSVLPFLPWAAEPVAAGREPSFFTVSLFALEWLLVRLFTTRNVREDVCLLLAVDI